MRFRQVFDVRSINSNWWCDSLFFRIDNVERSGIYHVSNSQQESLDSHIDSSTF
jgi:hypothetical protein